MTADDYFLGYSSPAAAGMAENGGTAANPTISKSNEQALLQLMEKTGYSIVQENGQRKYGGPPPDWKGSPPPKGSEIFVGKIPRDCFEDELVPIFESVGKIYEFRLMMDFSGSNRGYGFVMYTNPTDAQKAVKQLNNFEIRKSKYLGVVKSVDNCRLFVGGIPKTKTKEEILGEMSKVTEGVVSVILYSSVTDKSKSRGFAFVEYENHRAAAMARRKLIPGKIQLWGHEIAVDWAEPEPEVDEETMMKVTILYVRNLTLNTTEDQIREAFNGTKDSCVEKVKKLRDFAFIHYRNRDDAQRAMMTMNNALIDGSPIEVTWAKPVDKGCLRFNKNGTRSGCFNPNNNHFQSQSGGSYSYNGHNGYDNSVAMASYNGYPPQVSPGPSNGNGTMVRSPVRVRGRGAAGMRGGRGGGYVQNSYIRAYRRPAEVLSEFCRKNNWGEPVYHLFTMREGSSDVQLYMYKVVIPAFPTHFHQAGKLCHSPDDAKSLAAEHVLGQLGVSYHDGMESPPANHMSPLSPHQNGVVPAYTHPPGRPIAAAVSYQTAPPPVRELGVTFAPTSSIVSSAYVVANGKLGPYEHGGYYDQSTPYPPGPPMY